MQRKVPVYFLEKCKKKNRELFCDFTECPLFDQETADRVHMWIPCAQLKTSVCHLAYTVLPLICPLTGILSSDTCFIFSLFTLNHSILVSLPNPRPTPPPTRPLLLTLRSYFFLSRKESVSP